jgi:hypothetical protein
MQKRLRLPVRLKLLCKWRYLLRRWFCCGPEEVCCGDGFAVGLAGAAAQESVAVWLRNHAEKVGVCSRQRPLSQAQTLYSPGF